MQKLMIDMDEVITIGGFLYLVNEFLGTNYTLEDVPDYYVEELVPEEAHDEYWKFFFSKNVYDYCELLPNAYEVIKELYKIYKICIGTAYYIPSKPRESAILLMHKHIYLLDELPFLTPDNFAFVNDKTFLDSDIRIDDKLDNLEGARRKILFSAYHNVNISQSTLRVQNVERADNWLDIRKLLLKK